MTFFQKDFFHIFVDETCLVVVVASAVVVVVVVVVVSIVHLGSYSCKRVCFLSTGRHNIVL